MTATATPSAFLHELAAYDLLARAGLHVPRHGVVGGFLPFAPGEPVVLKGIAEELWHKSELGCVRFLPFDAGRLTHEAGAMLLRVQESGLTWIDGLVCERIDIQANRGLPSEAFVSLSRTDAGWVILCGFGGLQANALAELAPPCRWPVDVITPDAALAEFSVHLLGRAWLGQLRDAHALTTTDDLREFFAALWQLAALCEAEGLSLLELNPVALDPSGRPRPLDAVGRRAAAPEPRVPPPEGFLEALREPRRIALAGVSSQPGGVGRTILENLHRYGLPPGDLLLIKPGTASFLGLPCVPDVSALHDAPVDLLILALPAPAAAEALTALIAHGGGARCVALVSGGLGDGADTTGLGRKLQQLLRETRAAGKWTPAVIGPNFLGHWAPARSLDTSFIPTDKLAAPATTGGELTLLSQSGAFLLCRRSRQPSLRFGLGLALGNQMDVAMADVLAALADEEKPGPVACYAEGFGPGHLAAFAKSARTLTQRGAPVLLHRAGRTEAGQAAAASHTGAMAGNLGLERALLERCGVKFSGTIAEFDAALTWLAAYPHLRKGPVALLSNAGFESVNGSDLFGRDLPAAQLSPAAAEDLAIALAKHNLAGLVAPRLPLDLTPMAEEPGYLAAADVLLRDCAVLVVGLVPFTRKLGTTGGAARDFAHQLAAQAKKHGKPVAVAVDAGSDYEEYRMAFAAEGLAVFDRIESALLGLKLL
ncbi:MAG: hypothetical protein C0502_03650 [Opitutus sp.]|nr:hypothetical protein [Opitutus sp.]